MGTFKAIVVDKTDSGQSVAFTDFDEGGLMDGNVVLRDSNVVLRDEPDARPDGNLVLRGEPDAALAHIQALPSP